MNYFPDGLATTYLKIKEGDHSITIKVRGKYATDRYRKITVYFDRETLHIRPSLLMGKYLSFAAIEGGKIAVKTRQQVELLTTESVLTVRVNMIDGTVIRILQVRVLDQLSSDVEAKKCLGQLVQFVKILNEYMKI